MVTTQTDRLTFAELAELEPQLAALEREIKAWVRTSLGASWCKMARWYGFGRFKHMGYRQRMAALGARGGAVEVNAPITQHIHGGDYGETLAATRRALRQIATEWGT